MRDKKEIKRLYRECYDLANELCPPVQVGQTEEHDIPIYENNPLLVTTFHCILWDALRDKRDKS